MTDKPMKNEILRLLKDIGDQLEDIIIFKDGGAGIAQQLADISNEIYNLARVNLEVVFCDGESFEIKGIKNARARYFIEMMKNNIANIEQVICYEYDTNEKISL